MNITPFIFAGCSDQVAEQFHCNDWMGDSMPLFALPVTDRINTYEQLDSLLEVDKFLRNNTIGDSRFEYQYILQLNSITDDIIKEYRKIYALTSGTLTYYNEQQLKNDGWDISAIFESGRPAEAFELKPIQLIWENYYPGNLPLNVRFFYFNFLSSEKEKYIKPLISCHVTEELKKNIFSGNIPSDWQDQFYTSFIDHQFPLTITVGDVLGEADHHVFGGTDNVYRLSMHYLQDEYNADYSHNVTEFMRFRSRIPLLKPIQGANVNEQFIMAGHPLITKQTNIPASAARVDFIDQNIFSTKSSKPLSLDIDQNPAGLVIRRRPSAEQDIILQGLNIDLNAPSANTITIYNPDGQYLKIIVTDPPDSSIQIISPEISSTELVKTINIIPPADNTISTARLQVVLTDPAFLSTLAVIHEIDLTFLDCKLVPVTFWQLHDAPNSHLPSHLDIQTVLSSVNSVLGEQCNVYLYWGNPQVNLPEIAVVSRPAKTLDTSLVLEQVLLYLKDNASHMCNIIWTWNLDPATSDDEAGETLPVISDFLYPIAFVESSIDYSDDDRGKILAHEFCHWLIHYNIYYSAVNNEDAANFNHDVNVPGNYSYAYNLMQPDFAREHISLTMAQRLYINQNVNSVGLLPD